MKHFSFHMPKMTSKTVWIGCYFDHYNGIIIFSKHPVKSNELDNEGNLCYDMHDNRKIIAATLGIAEFKKLFPNESVSELVAKNGNVISTEPTKLIKCSITACWDGDKLRSFDFDATGYSNSHS